MSYRRALVRRWSRRDWLAVAVVALAVAFLTGSGLVVDATATATTEIAAQHESPATATWYDSVGTARAAAGPDAVVLPVARVRVDGSPATVVGVPPGETAVGNRTDLGVTAPPPGIVRRGSTTGTVRLEGRDATVRVTRHPREGAVLSPQWYVAREGTVDRLGRTGAVVVVPADGGDAAAGGRDRPGGPVPLRGALPFFLAGARSALRLLGLVAAGAAALLSVAVFGVARITVRDRLRTIRVIRATGAPPRTVLGLFAARAGGQTAVGVTIGYGIGVVATNAAVSVAVFAGHPVALAPRVSGRLAGLFAPAYAGLVVVGALGGALAAWPAARVSPARVDAWTTPAPQRRDARGRLRRAVDGAGRISIFDRLSPEVVGWRAVLPTATTLAVFVAVAVVATSTYGVVAPLSAGQGGTITAPDAPHPIASEVPAAYAASLRDRGVAASAEILLLSVHGGQPFLARGANFSAFARLSGARLVAGRAPAGPGEAVVGVDLARTLDLTVGEHLLLGGSTATAVTRVRIVGVYRAREPFDDQLVVPLATGRHLAGLSPGTAHMIRVERLPRTAGAVSVTVDSPREVPAGRPFRVSVTVVNPSPSERTRTVVVQFGDSRRRATVTVQPGGRKTVDLRFRAGSVRNATLTVGNRTRRVRVVSPDALDVRRLPARAPPGSEPRARVVTETGTPVANATVTVGGRTRRTGPDGWVRVPIPESASGEVRVRVATEDRSTMATVRVTESVTRTLVASIAVEPARPTAVTRPTARVTLRNPWNRTLTRTVTVVGPGGSATRQVSLAPSESTTVSVRLARRPPGTYDIRVRTGRSGERGAGPLATATYRVGGDQRLAAAIAATGRDAPTTGLGRAAAVLFGNLRLLVAVLVSLAGLMTAGATAAGFAGAVHGRRQTLGVHRAVGASRRAVLGMVVGDAAVVGAVATVLAVVVAGLGLWALASVDLLTVYGVRLLSTASPAVVAATAVAAYLLALLGATAAALSVVRTPPARLLVRGRSTGHSGGLSDGDSAPGERRPSEKPRGHQDGFREVEGDG